MQEEQEATQCRRRLCCPEVSRVVGLVVLVVGLPIILPEFYRVFPLVMSPQQSLCMDSLWRLAQRGMCTLVFIRVVCFLLPLFCRILCMLLPLVPRTLFEFRGQH